MEDIGCDAQAITDHRITVATNSTPTIQDCNNECLLETGCEFMRYGKGSNANQCELFGALTGNECV